MRMRLGIDIGGTKVLMGLLGPGNAIASKRKLFIPKGSDCRSVLGLVSSALPGFLAESGLTPGDIGFCGVGIPGTVSGNGRTAIKVPNLGWENEPCADMLKELSGLDALFMQDSRAGAIGEYLAGSGQGSRTLVCITLGTGIGTGIVIDGKVFHGGLGGAGEVGHILSEPGGRPCGCGQRGCMETYAAGRGIAQTASEHPAFKGRILESEDVFALADRGNPDAVDIIRDAVERLGRAVVAVVNVLSPDTLIFSGGMCSQVGTFVQPLMEYIRKHAYAFSVDDRLRMGISSLGEDAPMVGAALMNQEPMEVDV